MYVDPKVLFLYIEEIFLILITTEVDNILQEFNLFHDRLQLTVQMESNPPLAYWNTLAIQAMESKNLNRHQDEYFIFDPTITSYNLVFRAIMWGDVEFHGDNKSMLFRILMKTGFPDTESPNQHVRRYRMENSRQRLSPNQLRGVDFKKIEDSPTRLRWNCLRLVWSTSLPLMEVPSNGKKYRLAMGNYFNGVLSSREFIQGPNIL